MDGSGREAVIKFSGGQGACGEERCKRRKAETTGMDADTVGWVGFSPTRREMAWVVGSRGVEGREDGNGTMMLWEATSRRTQTPNHETTGETGEKAEGHEGRD